MANGDDSLDHRPHLVSRSLLLRTLSAVVLIPGTIFVVYLGGWVMAAFVVVAGLLMLHEWNTITEGAVAWPLFLVQAVPLLIVAGLSMANLDIVIVATTAIGVVLTAVTARFLNKSPLWPVAGLLYVLVPAVTFLWLREKTASGFELCLWTLAIVWATDIGGYAAGRAIGGPKLAPRLSPNKTWAGLAGGMALAAMVSAGIGPVLGMPQSGLLLAVLAAGLAVWEQAGDLAESALKRRFRVKDSGSLIPGHGGIMDRVDGLVFVLPVVAAGARLVLE